MAKAQQNLKQFRVPLVGTFQNRDSTLSKDQRFINCYPESRKNDITESKKIYLVKRPGLNPISTISVAVGRGSYYWNGKKYGVFGNTLYADSTSITTLTTTTGMCSFVEATTITSNVLIMADGDMVYVIKSDSTATAVPLSLSAWAGTTAYALEQRVVPTTANGFYYEVTVAGTSGGGEPTWPVFVGQQVVDGTITWECKGYSNATSARSNSKAYVVGQRITASNGSITFAFECVATGTSGGSTPTYYFTPGAITVDGSCQWLCVGEYRTDAPPQKHQPSLAFLDGYVFLVLKKTDGTNSADVYNSDLDNPYSWNPVSYITAEQFPDNATALARQNNMLVVFGDASTEFFYDNANLDGSPISRNTSYTLQSGIAAPRAIYQNEKFCIFVGQSQSGGRAVWLLDGFTPHKISDEYIERIIDAEGTSIVNATGFGLRTNGHLFYVLNLTNVSLVYDLEEQMWHQWTGVNCVSVMDNSTGKPILQHKTNGKYYYLDPTIGTDDSVAFDMEVITTKYDFETMNRKQIQGMYLVGDQVGTSETVSVRWSDDDYQTWSSWHSINISGRPYLPRLGAFRRRAFDIKYSGTYPLRWEALEFFVIGWKA